MENRVFGALRRRKNGTEWIGSVRLPSFAVFEVRPAGAGPMSAGEAEAALREARESIEKRLETIVGPEGARALHAAIDRARAEGASHATGPHGGESSAGIPAASEVREPSATPSGAFTLRVEDEAGDGPIPEQERAFLQLVEDEPATCRTVMEAVHRYYAARRAGQPEWYGDYPEARTVDDLRSLLRLEGVTVSRYHKDGSAYVGLTFECEWEEEHGLGVLWHNGRVVDIGYADVLEAITDADNLAPEWDGTFDSPHVALLAAVFARNDAEVDRLIAEGASVNAEIPNADPPLCLAVFQHDVGLVRRLLEIGADPALRNRQGQTPLDVAEEMLCTMVPAEGPAAALLAQLAGGRHAAILADTRSQMEEIVRLLQDSG